MTNFVDIFQNLSKEPSCYQVEALIVICSLRKGNGLWNKCYNTNHALLESFIIWAPKTLKLIFHKQPSCPKRICAEP